MAENEANIADDGAAQENAATEQTGDATLVDVGQIDAAQVEAAGETIDAPAEEITYHAVERDGQVAAIWEMQGRKHLRTIDPRSRLGREILRLYTAEQPTGDAVAAQG